MASTAAKPPAQRLRSTRRSSERAPAGTPSGDADVAGGWLPSLTFDVRRQHTMFTIGRQREKQHAVRYLHNKADTIVVDRVIDAAHDLIEGVASADAVASVFAEAFVTGGGGVWEQTGSWIRKLAHEYSSLHQLWLQLAPHKSARIRFRVAAFLNDMPDAIRQQLAATFLADPSAKVRSKTAGEISMRPTPDMFPLLQSRLRQEVDPKVVTSIQYALAAYATTSA